MGGKKAQYMAATSSCRHFVKRVRSTGKIALENALRNFSWRQLAAGGSLALLVAELRCAGGNVDGILHKARSKAASFRQKREPDAAAL